MIKRFHLFNGQKFNCVYKLIIFQKLEAEKLKTNTFCNNFLNFIKSAKIIYKLKLLLII